MKTQMLIIVSLALLGGSAQASELPACANIRKACESAGYQKGLHKGAHKGLYVDCENKLFAGQPVEGVTAQATDVEACKAHRDELKAKKAARRHAAPAVKPAS